MQYSFDSSQCRNFEFSSRREWVLPNGIGGYAMGTISGVNTRRYHGHLIAATTPPTGRMLLLAQLEASIQGDGNPVGLSANQYPGAVHPEGYLYLKSFTVDHSARWHYRAAHLELLKELYMHPGENAVTVRYQNMGEKPLLLALRPFVAHRDHHSNFHESEAYPPNLSMAKGHTTIEHDGVALTLNHAGAHRVPVQGWYYRFEHMREVERGLDPRDDLFCPCELRYELSGGEAIELVASHGGVVDPQQAPDLPAVAEGLAAGLRSAAKTFILDTPDRSSIIAGYPWFTDWGRDTMISLPGICLHTGRVAMARRILLDYASQIHQGLIPNRFVERGAEPDYNTVDATLWFANAIYRTLEAEWDQAFAEKMFATLQSVIDWHQRGTLFGIKVDPTDGLLSQGERGLQLTWMDAKVGDWVITPRHGKPVEINGLWINALRVAAWIAEKLGSDGSSYESSAAAAEASFNTKFWHPVRGHYLDTVDPADASLRPNQLIPMALPFVTLDPEHARAALGLIERELVTPNGVRTLGPDEPGYKGRFKGSLPELDAAYHQGTVWPWLLGPLATAIVRYTGSKRDAKRVLKHAKSMMVEYGIGGIAEVYDGSEPQMAGGCPWQAWSVGEILRAWVEDVKGD